MKILDLGRSGGVRASVTLLFFLAEEEASKESIVDLRMKILDLGRSGGVRASVTLLVFFAEEEAGLGSVLAVGFDPGVAKAMFFVDGAEDEVRRAL